MAPDKIYMPNELLSEEWQRHIEGEDTAYLRKDALLEIIETARESAVVQINFNNCPAEQKARIDAYDYIKRKIESL